MKQYLIQNRGKLTIATIVFFFVPAFLWTYVTQVRPSESTVSIERLSADDKKKAMTLLDSSFETVLSDAAVKSNGAPLGPIILDRVDSDTVTAGELAGTVVTDDRKKVKPFVSPFQKTENSEKFFDVAKFFQQNIDDTAFDASELQESVAETSAIIDVIVDEDASVEESSEENREDEVVVNSKEPVASGVSILAEVIESSQPEDTKREENESETTLPLSEDYDDEDDTYSQTSVLVSEKTDDTILEEVPGNTTGESETEEPLPTSSISIEEEDEGLEFEVSTTLEVGEDEVTIEFTDYSELFD